MPECRVFSFNWKINKGMYKLAKYVNPIDEAGGGFFLREKQYLLPGQK